jgi:hypothetical protein
MTRVRATILFVLAPALALLAPAGAPSRAEAVLLHDEARGLFDVSAYRTLVVDGLQGTLVLRLGRPGELRYESRLLATRRDPMPVALWEEETALVMTPFDEEDPQRLFVEVTVPPGLDVEIFVNGSVVHATGLQGELFVKGEEIELHASGLSGDASIEGRGGSVEVGASGGTVEIEGEALEVKLSRIAGGASLDLGGSTVDMKEMRGGIVAVLRETGMVLNDLQGSLRVEAQASRLEIAGANQGAILELDETPVSLVNLQGGVQLDTDSEVRFRDMKAEMVIQSYGGSIRGEGSTSSIELRTDGALVHLEQLQGELILEGQDLRVQLKELRGPAVVRTSMSELNVVDANAGMEVENDFGNVSITKVQGAVKVSSRDGEVRVSELDGSLQLAADGPQVDVSWSKLGGEENSSIVNASGNVVVALPAGGRCRLEAEAEYGRIDSGLDEIQVSDDGRRARGSLGGAQQPLVETRAGGQLSIQRYRPQTGG